MLIGNTEINDIVYDSRQAGPGTAFVCLRGMNTDGHKFAANAYEKGCRVFVCEEKLDLPSDAEQIIKPDTRIALAELSSELFGNPTDDLLIIGVTGTKGKTTVTSLVCDILNKTGRKAGVIGTTGIFIDGKSYPTNNTTPESYELHKYFRMMVDAGCEYAVMEVSSQAFKMKRVYGIEYYIGVFTNLSPDHIGKGEHKDFEEYRNCKSELFRLSEHSIINIDDENAEYMINNCVKEPVTYSINKDADFKAGRINEWRGKNALGVTFDCYSDGGNRVFLTQCPGNFSVYNALAVIAVCRQLGVSYSEISEYLPLCRVRGRFELVDAFPGVVFIVDYAHNEFSLENTLRTLGHYRPSRLVCLFGSVGNRTELRRSAMGKIAAELSDFCILTSDNPGTEDPENILNDIEKGFEGYDTPYVKIADRRKAIEYAVVNAKYGDIILLAGKGHETYQLIGKEKVPFVERDIILESVELRNAEN